jgi:hypothetical protein
MKLKVKVQGDLVPCDELGQELDARESYGRYRAIYRARDERSARRLMAQDEAALAPADTKVVTAHWSAPKGLFGKGELVAIFDHIDPQPWYQRAHNEAPCPVEGCIRVAKHPGQHRAADRSLIRPR